MIGLTGAAPAYNSSIGIRTVNRSEPTPLLS